FLIAVYSFCCRPCQLFHIRIQICELRAMKKQATSDNVCQRLKQFGYSPTQHIKQYGEQFEVISEPCADGNRFAVRVTSETRKTERLLTIPRNIIETAKRT